MATYIMLFNFTEQGIRNVKDSPARVEQGKKAFEKLGVQVKAFYSVMGRYDTVFIVEAPNDEAIARAALSMGALGNVRTETLRAFTEEEFSRIVASLP